MELQVLNQYLLPKLLMYTLQRLVQSWLNVLQLQYQIIFEPTLLQLRNVLIQICLTKSITALEK